MPLYDGFKTNKQTHSKSIVCEGGFGVCKVKVVSGWKKDINLKVLHSPVIQGAKVHLDLPRSQLHVPSGLVLSWLSYNSDISLN